MNEALAQTPTGKMKQLSNNFGDLKESLGNLTVNLAAPFVSALNVIVVKLTQAFNALSRFTAAMLKIKSFSFLGLGKSADKASGSIDGIAKSAAGAGKAVSKSVMGFDQLNRLDGADGGGGNSQVMPFDTGNMQNAQTYVDTTDLPDGNVSIVTGSPQARRLYYHPEYDFRKENNANAGGLWFDPWIDGPYKDFCPKTFAAFMEQLGGH